MFSAGLHCGFDMLATEGPATLLFPVLSAGLHCGTDRFAVVEDKVAGSSRCSAPGSIAARTRRGR
ncbi:hypothetical protein [Nocardioides rotundus]